MEILIKSIPHKLQRYPTCGDWFERDGVLHILVSEEMDQQSQELVALHELAEFMMCKANGVTQADVDNFDTTYESHRPPDNLEEPGDNPKAPYHVQHSIATAIERIVCAQMNLPWGKHADSVEALP